MRNRIFCLSFFLFAFLLFVLPQRLFAFTYCADKLTDGPPVIGNCPTDGSCVGTCSVRDAIQAANFNNGPDTINLIAGTYLLSEPQVGSDDDDNSGGDLDIVDISATASGVTINGLGPDQTIIDASGLVTAGTPDRVLHLVNDFAAITGVTFQGGHASPINSNVFLGGGIWNETTLLLTNCVVQDNVAQGPGLSDISFGGGICSQNRISALASLGLIDSIIQQNQALAVDNLSNLNGVAAGGGVYFSGLVFGMDNSSINNNSVVHGFGGGLVLNERFSLIDHSAIFDNTVSGQDNPAINSLLGTAGGIAALGTNLFIGLISNSTLSGNVAASNGGGLYYNVSENLLLLLASVTVFDNHADGNNDNFGSGGGIFNAVPVASDDPTLLVQNTIVGGNTAASNPDCSGLIFEGGYNLIQDLNGCTRTGNTTGDVTGQDPDLDVLAMNGGLTPTHALKQGSPALDTANPDGCLVGTGFGPVPTPTANPFDQRNDPFSRVVAGVPGGTPRCDIGAYEANTPDLEVVKTADASVVHIGDTATYTITVTNNGPGTSTGVVLTDTIPTQVSFVSASSTQGTCSESGDTVTCNIGSILEGDSVVVTVVVTIEDIGSITNTATGTENENDPDPSNNTSTVTITAAGQMFLQGSGRCLFSLNYNPTTSDTAMFLFLLGIVPVALGWRRWAKIKRPGM